MQFSRLFPNEYRAFCRGPLSLCVERFGGINSISLLDIREFEGKLYPDRFPVPWLCRRSGGSMGRPLYSPAIQFHHGRKNYVPESPELFPFGFRSPEYSLAVNGSSAAFRFAPHPEETFVMTLSRRHMPEGEMPSLKNQLAVIASGIQWLPDELRGPGFDRNKPFPESNMCFTRKPPVLRNGRVVFEAECRYADHVGKQFWVISSSQGWKKCTDIPHGWNLECPAGCASWDLGFGFGSTLAEAEANAVRTFEQNFQEGLSLCRPAFSADFEGCPEASGFIRLYPGYQRHLLLAETERETAIRAAADKFGFFALWDHIYPARDFLLTGEPERTKKAIRYLLDYPWVETCSWITMHLILTMNEYLAFVPDRAFLDECMPYFRRYLDFNDKFTHPDTGLLATSLNVGVDCSAEVGLDGLFYASCLNGWWYDSLRVLENFARETGDSALAERCLTLSRKIEAHYEEAFFDGKEGYLYAARKSDGSLPSVHVYQNTHTLGMDYLHGAYLFRHILRKLADYQAERLYHPMGHTAVSYDSAVPCEMWKSVHMNQHLGHECKTARMGGRPEEAERLMRGYLEYFNHYQCAIETFNLAGCDGDVNQLANWQAFSATAAAQGLLCGAAGWMYHRGGWFWVPGDGMTSRFHALNGKNFTISGKGSYAAGIILDGTLIPGTLQAPVDIAADIYEIHRTAEKPDHPVLLCAADAPVSEVMLREHTLSFRINAAIHAPVKVYSPERAQLRINGAEVQGEWDEQENCLWFDYLFHVGDTVEVSVSYRNTN
ncbi:MAG: hypothetical protein ACI4UV_09585 [Victivallales bacterium]